MGVPHPGHCIGACARLRDLHPRPTGVRVVVCRASASYDDGDGSRGLQDVHIYSRHYPVASPRLD